MIVNRMSFTKHPFLMLCLVTSDFLNGQTNKSSPISFLIQTNWRINYLIFEYNYQKPSWGSLKWVFIKWMLLWSNLVTLNFYDATPVVNTVKSTTSERHEWVCGNLQLYRSHLSATFYLSIVLPEDILILFLIAIPVTSQFHLGHRNPSGNYLLIWIKLVSTKSSVGHLSPK